MLATDTPTTLLAVAMTHYELPGLGLDGRNVDLVQIDAPFRSYLTSARALLRARSLEGLVGNWDRSDGLPPVLRPRLTPQVFDGKPEALFSRGRSFDVERFASKRVEYCFLWSRSRESASKLQTIAPTV